MKNKNKRVLASALALLLALVCAACGGKEEEETSFPSSSPAGTTAIAAESTVSFEEASEKAHQIYVSGKPDSVPDVTDEKFDEIMAGAYEITEKYFADGRVPDDRIEDVLQEKWEYMKRFVDDGTAVMVERTLLSCALTFANGYRLVYSAEVEGTLSGGGEDALRIISNAYMTTDNLPGNAEKAARLIVDSFTGYQLKESAIYPEEIDSFSRLLDILEDSSVLLFFGHGSDIPSLNTTLHKTNIMNDPRYDSRIGLSFSDAGMLLIDRQFIMNYFSDDSFQGAFIYLGACMTGSSDALANAFLEKGAEVVLANSSTVFAKETIEYRQALIEYMCKGMSVMEAKGKVDSENVSASQNQIILGRMRNVLFGYPQNQVILFGNSGYVFSDEMEYYPGRKYVFYGVIRTDESGRHYLELKSTVKIHGQTGRCSKIYFYDEVDTVLAEYENKENSFKGTVIIDKGEICLGNDAAVLFQDEYIGLSEATVVSYEDKYFSGKKYTFNGTIRTDGEGHPYLELEGPVNVIGVSEACSKIVFLEEMEDLLKEYADEAGTFRGTIILNSDGLLCMGTDIEVLRQGKAIKVIEGSGHGSEDPGRNTDKTFDKLLDFLGEPLEVVKQYYGEPDGGMGIDGNGECLSYEFENYVLMFLEVYEGGGTVDEIRLFLTDTSPEIRVTSSVTTRMNHDEIENGLSGFSCATEASKFETKR